VVSALLGACALGYRHLARAHGARPWRRAGQLPGWWTRWVPAPAAEDDRVEIAGRAFLGGRESVCVVRVGAERFLVGVSASGISLLGTLPAGEFAAPRAAEPAAPRAAEPAAPVDFAAALTGAVVTAGDVDERAMRASLARSRDRLARLAAGRTS
jgi:flagellar biosynthesis protein FliO